MAAARAAFLILAAVGALAIGVFTGGSIAPAGSSWVDALGQQRTA